LSIENSLRKLAPELIAGIQRRTLSGSDIGGKSFTSYSKKYKAFKARNAVFGNTPVNLALTGDMLYTSGSVAPTTVSTAQNVGLKLEIAGAFGRNKAHWNQGGNPAIPARHFFGLDDRQIQSIITELTKSIKI
jgi:phage gpG-like protein